MLVRASSVSVTPLPLPYEFSKTWPVLEVFEETSVLHHLVGAKRCSLENSGGAREKMLGALVLPKCRQ